MKIKILFISLRFLAFFISKTHLFQNEIQTIPISEVIAHQSLFDDFLFLKEISKNFDENNLQNKKIGLQSLHLQHPKILSRELSSLTKYSSDEKFVNLGFNNNIAQETHLQKEECEQELGISKEFPGIQCLLIR